MSLLEEAKLALDKVIAKSRIHFYKPIQIAEVLYHHRLDPAAFSLAQLEEYRVRSREWRRDVTYALVGRDSTSSARYQDDVFNDNAMPPQLLKVLGEENETKGGVVEAYIYQQFAKRHAQLMSIVKYVQISSRESFQLSKLLDSFQKEPGLRRSIDKVYEIVVYALFDALTKALGATVSLTVREDKLDLLNDFRDFAQLVFGVTPERPTVANPARLHRAGVTNASDRGLDMWANFGPVIQVKHLTLNPALAESIITGVEADRVVIVCKDCDMQAITMVLSQIGWGSHVQGIITESNLIEWYERGLRGKYASELADFILSNLRTELGNEFPFTDALPGFLSKRGYDQMILMKPWSKGLETEDLKSGEELE